MTTAVLRYAGVTRYDAVVEARGGHRSRVGGLSVAAALLGGLLFGGAPRVVGAAGECVVIEDFSRAKVGEFPAGWKPRKDAGREVYTVREEEGVRFLRAVARGLGIQAALQREWDLNAYPILAWSWRPVEFPQGADERSPKTNDSAVAVYAVFPHSPVSVKSLKYIWSERVARETRLTASKGLTQVRVLQSGKPARAAWIEERVNVLEDYRRSFDETDAPKPAGIAVLTDADDTRSRAQGDYANFRVCRG